MHSLYVRRKGERRWRVRYVALAAVAICSVLEVCRVLSDRGQAGDGSGKADEKYRIDTPGLVVWDRESLMGGASALARLRRTKEALLAADARWMQDYRDRVRKGQSTADLFTARTGDANVSDYFSQREYPDYGLYPAFSSWGHSRRQPNPPNPDAALLSFAPSPTVKFTVEAQPQPSGKRKAIPNVPLCC
jgi:hypothetical protein